MGSLGRDQGPQVTFARLDAGLERLFDLWVEHYEKLAEDARQRLPRRLIYFLAPGE